MQLFGTVGRLCTIVLANGGIVCFFALVEQIVVIFSELSERIMTFLTRYFPLCLLLLVAMAAAVAVLLLVLLRRLRRVMNHILVHNTDMLGVALFMLNLTSHDQVESVAPFN